MSSATCSELLAVPISVKDLFFAKVLEPVPIISIVYLCYDCFLNESDKTLKAITAGTRI